MLIRIRQVSILNSRDNATSYEITSTRKAQFGQVNQVSGELRINQEFRFKLSESRSS